MRKNLDINDLIGEIWLPIDGWEGCYEVSNMGRIKSFNTKFYDVYILTPVLKNEYFSVNLQRGDVIQQELIHILVATAFVPNPENKPTVNHKKGIKTDNRASELEWATQEEQIQHAVRMGLMNPPKGENHFKAKLTNETVLEIIASNLPNPELSLIYGVSDSAISSVKNGKAWRHVTKINYSKSRERLSEDKILSIYKDVGSFRSIAKRHNTVHATVGRIKSGKYYSDITKHNNGSTIAPYI